MEPAPLESDDVQLGISVIRAEEHLIAALERRVGGGRRGAQRWLRRTMRLADDHAMPRHAGELNERMMLVSSILALQDTDERA
jgi:hypothetical protein